MSMTLNGQCGVQYNCINSYMYTARDADKNKERYEMLAKGKYGGVGMSIDEVRDTVIITRVYEDSPSYFEGIMAGDMILKVDTTNVVGLTTSETVKLLKGELDTSLKIKILRRPGKEIKEFVFSFNELIFLISPLYLLNALPASPLYFFLSAKIYTLTL